MKNLNKTIVTMFVTAILFSGNSQVSASVEKRKPVLIDITGMRCTPCGDLSLWLDDYATNNSDALIIASHGAANFSDPASPFDIDMRTDDAYAITDAIALLNNGVLVPVTSFPTVLFNGERKAASTIPAETTIVENEDSYVNIDLQSTLNEATRELTVQIEMYFTEDAPQEAFLSVGVLQDDLFGYQISQPGSVTGNFTFNHVLRDVITDALGNSIGSPTQGQTLTETFNYTIPEFVDYSTTDIADDPELIIGDLTIYAYVATNEDVVAGGLTKKHHVIETGEYKHLESTASISNIELNQSINVWPNPSSVNHGISISSETTINNAKVIITDVLGKIVLIETGIDLTSNTPKTINSSKELTQGNYIISIEDETHNSFVKLTIQ